MDTPTLTLDTRNDIHGCECSCCATRDYVSSVHLRMAFVTTSKTCRLGDQDVYVSSARDIETILIAVKSGVTDLTTGQSRSATFHARTTTTSQTRSYSLAKFRLSKNIPLYTTMRTSHIACPEGKKPLARVLAYARQPSRASFVPNLSSLVYGGLTCFFDSRSPPLW